MGGDAAHQQPPFPPPTSIADLATDSPERLTRKQQREFERLVMLGASPAAACQRLLISLDAVWVALDQDDHFRNRLSRAKQALHDNVRAALYRSAMEGNVSAQTFWLRHVQPHAPATTEEAVDDPLGLRGLTDEELARLEQHEDELARSADKPSRGAPDVDAES